MPNFGVIPEKKFVLLTLKVGILEMCCEIQVIRNVRNENGCVTSSAGKVNLSFGFNDTI